MTPSMLPPLPTLTQAHPENSGSGDPSDGSLVPAPGRRALRQLASSIGAPVAAAYAATLWILLERYAGGGNVPQIAVLLPGRGARLLSLPHASTQSFREVVESASAATAISGGDAVDGPAAIEGRVVLVWEGDDMLRVGGKPGLVVRVHARAHGVDVVSVEEGGLRTLRSDAVEADLLTLLGALVASEESTRRIDAFSRPGHVGSIRSSQGQRLIDLVTAHAEETPDASAVRGKHALTYAHLLEKARQVGGAVLAAGVGVEDRVALLLERDEQLAVGLLGAQVAGATFVPLSPEDPPERQREILADAGVGLVLTTGTLADHLADELSILRLEECYGVGSMSTTVARSEQAAYVLYTSGSSGKPKGVVVEHRQLSAYVTGFLEVLGAEARPLSCALVQPLTVDSSLTCVGAAWATGGELQVIDRPTALDLTRLGHYLRDNPADILKIAPSHLRALQGAGDLGDVMPTQSLVIGGEASNWQWMQELDDGYDCAVYNHYGPTETTVGVLMLSVGAHRGRDWTTTALGGALGGCDVGVVDNQGMEVPAGIRGEIVIRGDLVARGYQTAPEKSGFRSWRGDHAYWTGDYGIRERDGVICFVGRADDQVKVRGHRVELGDIEHAVCLHPDVAQAVALVDDPGDGRAIVRCAVRATGNQNLDPVNLAEHCRSLLPQHMVPSSWVQLAEMPRSSHGKIDRRELRQQMAPVRRGPSAEDEAVEATPAASAMQRSEALESMVAAWNAVLADPVATHDVNFFDAGGHSLLLVELQREIRQRTGREVELLDLLQKPTIAEQAGLLLNDRAVAVRAQSSNRRERREALLRRRHSMTRQAGGGDD